MVKRPCSIPGTKRGENVGSHFGHLWCSPVPAIILHLAKDHEVPSLISVPQQVMLSTDLMLWTCSLLLVSMVTSKSL